MKSLYDYISEAITHDKINTSLGKYAGKIFLQTIDKYKEGTYIVHSKNEKNDIDEGVLKTYPSRMAIEKLIIKYNEKHIKVPSWVYETQKYVITHTKNDNDILPHIIFVVTEEESNEIIIDTLKENLLSSGYGFGAHASQKLPNKRVIETFQFEPKFHPDETNIIGRYLYHATTKSAWESIEKRGMFPTNKCLKGFTYDGRCFLFRTRNDELIKNYILKSGKRNINNGIINDEFVILEIDRNELSGTKFYGDPNMPINSAVFTYENIPSKAIKVVGEFTLKR